MYVVRPYHILRYVCSRWVKGIIMEVKFVYVTHYQQPGMYTYSAFFCDFRIIKRNR